MVCFNPSQPHHTCFHFYLLSSEVSHYENHHPWRSHAYPASSERYQLTDIDGEDAFIRIGSIAMVRVLLDAMKPVEEDDE
ncbi:hypothetical protein H9I80_001957 [Escherichia coli]|nr:hypothetical protein [Escherichia coli]EGC2464849.1 hypothetical protein [Escherichia coli]